VCIESLLNVSPTFAYLTLGYETKTVNGGSLPDLSA